MWLWSLLNICSKTGGIPKSQSKYLWVATMMTRSASQNCLGRGSSREVSGKWMEEKRLNFLFWRNLGPTYIIKVCGLWTGMKMATGIIQKFHVYDVGKKHVVLRPGCLCAASPDTWTLSECQPQQHTGKNFPCGHHTNTFPFGFTLLSTTVLRCWSWS